MANIQSNISTPKYTNMLSYQIKDSDKKFDYDSYCAPLYWFVKLYCKNTSLTMGDIGEKLHYSSGVLTKKLNTKNKQHHALTATDIENICSVLNTPLSSILFLYEKREILEKYKSKYNFDKLTNLISHNFEEILDLSCCSTVSKHQELSNPAKNLSLYGISSDSENTDLTPFDGKWYFYFPSSDSTIVYNRKKELMKDACKVPDDLELKELYDLYSEDHIFSGTVNIEKKNNRHFIRLKYLTNPVSLTVLQYDGTANFTPNRHAIFATLTNEKDGDIMYLIADTLSVEKNSKYIMASVLFLSKNKNEFHRRPCSSRMILSRNIISLGAPIYNVMIANLMMNDNVIRIDDQGYEELKKHQEQYASPALNLFLEKYPSIELMKNESNFINVHNCAYINEPIIKSLKGVNPKDALYLEALLRLHSIAPWYSKTKSSKANELLKIFSNDRN